MSAYMYYRDEKDVTHRDVPEADREKARAYWCGKVPEEYRRGCG